MNESTHSIIKEQLLKVSYFQNEFMDSSFLPKSEAKYARISVWHSTGQNFLEYVFDSYFGRSNNFINAFWNLLTFSKLNEKQIHSSKFFTPFRSKMVLNQKKRQPIEFLFHKKRPLLPLRQYRLWSFKFCLISFKTQ